MGVVYRAYDEVLHRDVAVKVVNKGVRIDSSASQRLLHEARASSSLSHPNICTIHEVGETNGELYIVMGLVEGKSRQAMSGDGGLPPESVLRYGAQIASALTRAHDRGIVHRDLKTANIVVAPDGLVKVLDFGLAKQVGGSLFEGTTRTFATVQEASSVSGTLPYMAPEILRGDAADYRTDLWALGVVLYEAASGRLPFEGRTGFEISSAIMRELPNPLGPPVPPGLWAIMQRCLAKEPAQRYQRAGDDFGKSWTNPQQATIRFPSDTGVSLKNIWQITLGRPEEPNVLYCGVEPAALFETRDAGETWSLVRGLFDHPHRPRWVPGNGGLALHSIVLDPADSRRMDVAISSGRVYRTS